MELSFEALVELLFAFFGVVDGRVVTILGKMAGRDEAVASC